MMLYISGPMSGYVNKNYSAFFKGTALLRAKGYNVLSPHELLQDCPTYTWQDYMKRDIKELMRCTAIATLPYWKKSRGASLEVYIAKALSYPVHSVNYWLKRRVSIFHTSKKQ